MAERSDGDGRGGLRSLWVLLRGHLRGFRAAHLQDVATATLREGPGRRPWVLVVVNTTLRIRRALTYALVLRPRSALSRGRFLAGPRRTPATARTISLLCPTRGRVRLAATFLRSVARTAAAPGRVQVLFYVDDDDPDLPAYRALFADAARCHPTLGGCVLHVGPPIGVAAAWNTLAEAASGGLLAMVNDDQLYVDHAWDLRLDQRFGEVVDQHPDEICCLYFVAGQYPDGAADFPILSRAWYRTLGYFTPTIFAQWEVETWVFDLARRVDRLIPVPGVLVEHRHYQDYKAPFDATYQRHRMTREKSFADHTLFLRTAGRREAEAERLRVAIARAGDTTVDPEQLWFVGHLRRRLPSIRAEVAGSVAAGPDPDRRCVVLFRGGAAHPTGATTFPLTTAVLAEIPEATTMSPGAAVLHRVAPGRVVQTEPAGRGLRVLVGIRSNGEVVLQPAGRDLPEGEFRVLDGDVPCGIRNDGTDPAVVLVLDVPPVAG